MLKIGGVRDECPSLSAATVTENTVRAHRITESLENYDRKETIVATDVPELGDILGHGDLLWVDVRDGPRRRITSQQQKLY